MTENEQDAVDSFMRMSPAISEGVLKEIAGDEYRNPWIEGGVVAKRISVLIEEEPLSPELEDLLVHMEELLGETDEPWLANWLKVGVIETLQNYVSNSRLTGERTGNAFQIFERLGTNTKKAWMEVNDAWGNSVDHT
jgi:hypothetical protein